MKRFFAFAFQAVVLLLAIAALILSGFTLYQMVRLQQAGQAATAEIRAALDGLPDYTIETSVPFQHTFPFEARVPLQEQFDIPIPTTIPISTVARVPIEIPLIGTYELRVPVRAEVPVSVQVIVPVSETLDVSTSVAVDVQVPVQIEMSQLGLEMLFQNLDAALQRFEQGLRGTPVTLQKP